MKKILYLCRHAHAGESNRGDFYRELNHEGKAEVKKMAARVVAEKYHADLIVSSPALRALQTAHGIAKALNYELGMIMTDQVIYHQELREMLALIRHICNGEKRVWIFGHNPSMAELAAALTGTPEHKTPPGSIVAIEFEAPSWEEALQTTGKIIFREHP